MKTSPEKIRIYLLGKFEVVRSGAVLMAGEWPRRKSAALLQRLAYKRRMVKDQAKEVNHEEHEVHQEE